MQNFENTECGEFFTAIFVVSSSASELPGFCVFVAKKTFKNNCLREELFCNFFFLF